MAAPVVERSTGDVIPAADHNDVKDYIEDGTYRINTLSLNVQGVGEIITSTGSITNVVNLTMSGNQIIDTTGTEALLIRKASDSGDVFTVDTTGSVVSIGGRQAISTATDLAGSYASSVINTFTANAAGAGGLYIKAGASSSSGKSLVVADYSSNEDLVVYGDGDVYMRGYLGVGDSTPDFVGDFEESASGAIASISITNSSASADSHARYRLRAENGDTKLLFDSNAATLWNLGMDKSNSNFIISENATGALETSPKISIATSTGNVGIGTSSPSYKLELNQSSDTSTGGLGLINSVGSSGRIYVSSNNDLILQRGSNDNQFVIDSGGNVGIGTDSPDYALHINGGISVLGLERNNLAAQNNEWRFKITNAAGSSVLNDRSLVLEPVDADADFAVSTDKDGVTIPSFVVKSNNGNVGIGTTSPTAGLFVEKDTTTDSQLLAEFRNVGGAGDYEDVKIRGYRPGLRFYDGSSTAANFRIGVDSSKLFFSVDTDDDETKDTAGNYDDLTAITVLSSGDVGIGTDSPGAKLDVRGGAIFNDDGADVDFRIESDSDANAFFVDGGNNMVGIGTAVPSEKLHVKDGSDARIKINTASTTLNETAAIDFLISTNDTADNRGAIIETVRTNSPATADCDLLFYTHNNSPSEKMRITAAGNVGIGTDSPSEKLHVYSSANSDEGIRIVNPNSGSSASASTVILSDISNVQLTSYSSGSAKSNENWLWSSDSDGELVFGTDSTERMRIDSDGNVGIGTDSPEHELHTKGSTNVENFIESTGTGTSYAGLRIGTTVGDWGIYTGESSSPLIAGDLGFYDWEATSYRMVIKADGNVGIGTTSPDYTLSITDDDTGFNVDNTGELSIYAGGTELMRLDNNDSMIYPFAPIELGSIELTQDSGYVSLVDFPISSTPSAGTTEAYTFNIASEKILQVWSTADGTGGLSEKAVIVHTQDGAIADASLSNNETTFYLDEAGDTLTFKVKYSNGTVKTGTVALS